MDTRPSGDVSRTVIAPESVREVLHPAPVARAPEPPIRPSPSHVNESPARRTHSEVVMLATTFEVGELVGRRQPHGADDAGIHAVVEKSCAETDSGYHRGAAAQRVNSAARPVMSRRISPSAILTDTGKP